MYPVTTKQFLHIYQPHQTYQLLKKASLVLPILAAPMQASSKQVPALIKALLKQLSLTKVFSIPAPLLPAPLTQILPVQALLVYVFLI